MGAELFGSRMTMDLRMLSRIEARLEGAACLVAAVVESALMSRPLFVAESWGVSVAVSDTVKGTVSVTSDGAEEEVARSGATRRGAAGAAFVMAGVLGERVGRSFDGSFSSLNDGRALSLLAFLRDL